MKILAFDTSTQQCSVALYLDGEMRDISLSASNRHAELILSMIQSLLNEAHLTVAQLDVIGFSRGPGSFTGLRIGASLAQGLACAHDIPVASISTLQALAQAAHHTYGVQQVAAAIDARMQQIYWGTFMLDAQRVMISSSPEIVVDPATVTLPTPGWFGVGSGWAAYTEQLASLLPQITAQDLLAAPEARTLAWLAHKQYEQNSLISAEYALPIYLRDKVC